ncbi:hypothetical protein ABZT03_23070 [Streptomyces sp. NPDC005574]|uniref:hypothetical protein n=1 Tax=Streptomyces sp. NPDC005574 TaxID=3156891 RepID=UPI0033BBA231
MSTAPVHRAHWPASPTRKLTLNRRSTLIAAIALTAAAALSLSACGSDHNPGEQGGDRPSVGGAAGGASASPRTSASPSFGRPAVQLPSDVTDTYEGWKTGEEAEDAVLSDAARRIDATNDAILRGDTGAPGLSFYYRDKALSDAVAWVQAYLDANLTFTGTTRYYAPKVTLSGGTAASVVYCSDESKGFNKNRRTGKVDRTPTDDSPYVLYNTRLEKSGKGVWQTTRLTSKRGGADGCQP